MTENNTDPTGLSSSLDHVSSFLLAHYAADSAEGRSGDRDFAWVDYEGETVALNAEDLFRVLNAAYRFALFPQPTPTSAPPSIADMVPGTTFTARHADPEECGGADHRWFLLASRRIVISDHGQRWSVDSIDPSTIRDVTPPTESIK